MVEKPGRGRREDEVGSKVAGLVFAALFLFVFAVEVGVWPGEPGGRQPVGYRVEG